MTLQPTVSVGFARSLVDFAELQGGYSEAILKRANLSVQGLSNLNSRLSLGDFQHLVEAAKDITQDPFITLKWAAAVDMSEISIVGLIMNASRTMGDAFAQLQRYARLAVDFGTASTGGHLQLQTRGTELWMVDRRQHAGDFPELTEMSFARLVCGPRQFLPQSHVLEVHFTHPDPGNPQMYEDVFACPVKFTSDWNALKLHPELESWPVATQPEYVFGILTDHADQLLTQTDQPETLGSKVEKYLVKTLHTGDATANDAALKLNITRQTLYRKLKKEGTSFRKVLSDVRSTLAKQYLRSERLSVAETAYLLGYSDPAAFSRAFKRQTGINPKDVT